MTRVYDDHFYQVPDGLTLYARQYAGDPNKAPLLCMHGLTRNSADFHDMLSRFPDRPAISVDQRGRGRSDYDPDTSRYRPDVYCGDMLHLLSSLGLDRVVAIGTSMGGLMTMMLAAQKPGLFQSAIINDIGPEVDPVGLKRLSQYVGGSMRFESWDHAVAAIRAQGPDIFPDFNEEDWLNFAKNLCEETDDSVVSFRYDPAIAEGLSSADPSAVPPDLWPLYLTPSALPMLIIRGETSDILSQHTAERMVKERSDATLVTVPARGHAPTLTEPVAIAAIRRFLDTQP
jgi:pimeloyl-ACP methyl ester carboxylesterase